MIANKARLNNFGLYELSKKIDPTMTTSLRNLFARDMNKRFLELTATILLSVDKRDCFGLKTKVQALQSEPLGYRQFAFLRNPEKVEAFMAWLQEQVDKGLLKVAEFQQIGRAIESVWTNMYIYDSYKRGVLRARSEMKQAGLPIPSLDESGGIEGIMNTPFHMDRVGLLFTRTFTELKNITSAMGLQISKVLSQGLIDGDGARLIARKLIATINGDGIDRLGITDTLGRFIPAKRRAEMLARTEIIRAHAEAQLQEFKNWGVIGVNTKAEWVTTNDDRVCPKCGAMEGKIFTLEEASGKIPFHPFCRCCWLPWIPELQKYH